MSKTDIYIEEKIGGQELKLVYQIELEATDLTKEDLADKKLTELLTAYTHKMVNGLQGEVTPQKVLEYLITSKGRHIILTVDLGGGKTTDVCLFLLQRTYQSDERAIVIVNNKVMGEVIHSKLRGFTTKLTDKESKIVTYYSGNDDYNRKIRNAEIKPTIIITTLYQLLGSLTKFSRMTNSEEEEKFRNLGEVAEEWGTVFTSDNEHWARKIMETNIIFIDEIDSFPEDQRQIMSIFIKSWLKINPNLQVILASGTVSNVEQLANQFLGKESDYLHIAGRGRRGKKILNVYEEDKKRTVFNIKLLEMKEDIETDVGRIDGDKNFSPEKRMIYLNNKLIIDVNRIKGFFGKFFTTIHGNMGYKKVAERMRKFKERILKVVAVATSIIQAGIDIPSLTSGLMLGVPKNKRQMKQILHRFSRNPSSEGIIDIILRPWIPHEGKLLHNEEFAKEFFAADEVPALITPNYTPFMLKFALVLGVVLGEREIYQTLAKEYNIKQDRQAKHFLEVAYEELVAEGIIRPKLLGQILPTRKTKDWIFDLSKRFMERKYKVILVEGKKKTELGTESYRKMVRHHLEKQDLPCIDQSTVVTSIDHKEGIIYVTKGIGGITYSKNKIAEELKIVSRLTNHKDFKLVNVVKKLTIEEVDARTGPIENIEKHNKLDFFRGIFTPIPLTDKLEEDITALADKLSIDMDNITIKKFYDHRYGDGTLLLDESKLGMIDMIYYQLVIQEEE